jgi:hypothetical protein
MRRLKLWVALTIIAGGFAVSAVAGGSPRGNHTELVTAVFDGHRLTAIERTCAGDDGQYRQAIETYAGGVGGDPRLDGSGLLTLTTFTNTTTGNGTAVGTARGHRRHDSPGSLERRGAGRGHRSEPEGGHDRFRAGSLEPGRRPADRELSRQHNGTSFYVGIGFPATTANPAVIQGGFCSPAAQ